MDDSPKSGDSTEDERSPLTSVDGIVEMRQLLQQVVDLGSPIADIFINDDMDEVSVNFVDGSRLVFSVEDVNLVSLQRTNGKGGWI
jgi:hypothetical protein